ncbi:hypothetical protein [Halovivax cerinus]|uniref:Uncharacterized protein n=1 Tax=Halovivax cerinus TaxID=1487865 RepID=A0ABD5NPE7_9EURY|nr:hypothetical protein [Halovivax cerinus]
MRRRTLIASLASTATIPVVAGCLTDDDTDNPDDGNESPEDDSGAGDDGSGEDNESTGDGNGGSGDDNESIGDGNESDGNESNESTQSIETLSQTEVDGADVDQRNVECTASVSVDAETIEINGQLEAPTPCHEAVIGDVTVEDDTMTVTVELESGTDPCTQAISQVEYEATLVVVDQDVSTVVVMHEDRVGTETAERNEL